METRNERKKKKGRKLVLNLIFVTNAIMCKELFFLHFKEKIDCFL